MKQTLLRVFLLLFIPFTYAQVSHPTLDYYLPDNVSYNPEIPTPQELLGYVPGEWHVSHDLLVSYMEKMAASSPRITIENRGRTFEGRPILLLTVTSPENHKNIAKIKKQHAALTDSGSESLDTDTMPIVTYQGMSIHGNEASGSNAGLLAIYYLAAAEGPAIDLMLENVVILFDPSFNPDGLQHFSYWANTNKNQSLTSDPQDREYREVWPGGRYNHYWFDLNRDWLPAELPESQARIKTYHAWHPNILTDHHEMGSNSSFFFQPGIQSRTHPLTPKLNQELTAEIGKYHAAAFDKIGSFYYTEEDYDDFYYGKGSTFPDINGSIGILFEQASSRGHIQETDNGLLTFPFTIRNQFTAFLSTIEAAQAMRIKLLNYQRDFYASSRSEAGGDAYIFGSKNDPARAAHLAQLLQRHQISVYEADKNYESKGLKFDKKSSYVIPKNQKHSRLLQGMFEKRTTFKDSLFYDISAWSFPLAFNLDFSENAPSSLASSKIDSVSLPTPLTLSKSDYAYLLPWGDYYAPQALNEILNAGLRAKVGIQPFTSGGVTYDYGTVMIPVQNQKMNAEELNQFLDKVAKDTHLSINPVKTGLTDGIDLGSRKFIALEPQKIALLVGDGINATDAGEIWHLLDTRFHISITKLDTKSLSRTDLSKYTTLIMPTSGWGGGIDESSGDKISEWVRGGGNFIGFKNAARWMKRQGLIDFTTVETDNPATNVTFEQRRDFNGAQVIGGAIFKAKIDRSHPIAFGYDSSEINLFRDTTLFIETDETSYKNPISYTDEPLVSGYISDINYEAIKGTRPFVQQSTGRGNVILFTDNTNFRAFWYGTTKLFMNAIFLNEAM
ncbi:M14 family zinc carboxypeptidase [Leeuwenhoekiella marinoflava]|uniref:Zinc carboxypeptidase n=2 Tax=Leeuwenhoekiella marinoflava TaxID=988 RepID=A0A4Q0PRM0_9FLAO|nr:M14 family zinc carboxypeptidase [Leeuwenhoekiella marinoflava]RXG32545.1 zinc carboxypeptidase [Leeuwenhoekiella marinoflava]SHE67813.1 Zinc carboxypeptidase [Leeuwenhoekiella marinoflava DSM 3653]